VKKRKIVLECITASKTVATYAPIQRASKSIPKWWIDVVKNPEPVKEDLMHNTTMAGCTGMRDMYASGVMLPLWCELRVAVGSKGTGHYQYQFSDFKSKMGPHESGQRGEYLPDYDYLHLKIDSPWLFRCDEPINFYFAQPTWNIEKLEDYTIMPGVVDFKYQNTTNINVMFPRTDHMKVIDFPFRQPLAHIVPLDSRPIELKRILDKNLHAQIAESFSPITFVNSFKNKKAIDKKLESKCPFGFGRNK
jgi:hypothetical protein